LETGHEQEVVRKKGKKKAVSQNKKNEREEKIS